MNNKTILSIIVVVLIVVCLTFALVHLSLARSNDTINRIDQKIEEVMDR